MAYGPTYSTYNITATGTTGYSAAKDPAQGSATLTISGTYSTVAFTLEGTAGGGDWFPISCIDASTNLPIAGSTTISPSDNAEAAWIIPAAANLTAIRTNVSSYGSGTAAIRLFATNAFIQPTITVSSTTGSFTNVTASGTLGVTGLSTFTGGTLYPDDATAAFGTGSDILMAGDGTRFNVTQAATNSEIRWGVDGAGIDQRWYGDTASAYALWDQSADALVFGGAAGITNIKAKQSTAVAITGATSVALADSGGIFSVSQASAYDIDLPSPTTGAGATYVFYLTGPAANNVTITVAGSAATFVGTIVNDVTSVVPATGSTLTFASGAAALGDTIIIRSIATNLYHVQAVSSAAGGITIA